LCVFAHKEVYQFTVYSSWYGYLVFNFEKLIVYQKAIEFSNSVYRSTLNWDKKFQFNLADQFRRASLSISLNIAEGSSKTKKDFKRFILISRGSAYECVPIIEIAMKQKVITRKQYEIWYNQISELAKMLSVLRNRI